MTELENSRGLDDGQQRARKEVAVEEMLRRAGNIGGPEPEPADTQGEPYDEVGMALPIAEELDGLSRPDLY